MNHPSGRGPNARRRGRCAGRSRALGQPSQMGGQAPISSLIGLFGRRGAASPDTTAKAATPVSAADANVSLRVWCDEEREPSRLCSGTSCGLLGTGLCGIGRRPSAVASPPVRIASTPGASAAAATSILACACGERRMYAKACPGRLKSFAYGLGPSADAHPRARGTDLPMPCRESCSRESRNDIRRHVVDNVRSAVTGSRVLAQNLSFSILD